MQRAAIRKAARWLLWHGLQFAGLLAFCMSINDDPEASFWTSVLLPAVVMEITLDIRLYHGLMLVEDNRRA